MPCQFGDSPMSLDKKNYITGNQKRQALFLNFLNLLTIYIFLLDLNKSNKDYLCTDVLYLIEPSILKLNKLAMLNPKLINDIKGKMVVLNKSVLSKSEQADFEVETGIKVFYNIPPLNDKKDNSDILLPLLEKLGYIKKEEEQEKKKSIFDFLKFK